MPTLSITTNASQAQRIATAFGRLKNRRETDRTPRDATGAEVKAEVIDFIKQVVISYEQDVAMQAASNAVPDITPS